MSVSIEVCKDVEQFQESVVAGMDARHTVFALAGIALGSITGAISHLLLHLNHMITMYLVMFAAIPIIMIGFLDKDGMGIWERIQKGRALKKSGTIYYISTESPASFAALQTPKEETSNPIEAPGEQENMKKQLTRLAIVGTGLLVLVIAALLWIL